MEIFGGVRGGFARKGMDTQRDLGPYRESAGVNGRARIRHMAQSKK